MNRVRLGLTGGIGSGKSTVSSMFKDLGAFIIDYDQLSNQVELENPSLVQRIAQIFQNPQPSQTVHELDHQLIAQIVFKDRQKLKQLEKLKHPYIIDLANQIEQHYQDQYSVFVHEVPLLVESGLMKNFDKIVVLTADENVRILRVIESRNMNAWEVKARIKSQISDRDRAKYADFIIDTNQPLDQVQLQVQTIWNTLTLTAPPLTS
jgi:dephospho-CoA kinase